MSKYSLAKYRAEAKGDPFELEVDDQTTISIGRPTGDQMFVAESSMRSGNSRETVKALCGDQGQAVLDVLGPEDAAVLKSFSKDLQEHFGLGE